MPEALDAQDPFGLFDGYTKADVHEPSDEEKQLVTKLNDWLEKSRDARRSYDRDWEFYRLYLKGEAVARHRETSEVVRLSIEDSKRLRSRNNQLRPIARSFVGKLAKMVPTCTALPATADFAEQHGAKVADAFFNLLNRKEEMNVKFGMLCEYIPWAGNAFLEVVWDPLAGQKVAFCETCDYYSYDLSSTDQPCPQCSSQRASEVEVQQNVMEAKQAENMSQLLLEAPLGEQIDPAFAPQVEPEPLVQSGPLGTDEEVPNLVEAHEGDVRIHVRDPRDVYLPVGITDVKEASRVCIIEATDVTEARRRFPEFADKIQPDSGLYTDRVASWRHNTLDTNGQVDWLEDHVYIKRFYEGPSESYKEGRILTLINDILVEQMDSPYKCLGRLPLFHFGGDLNPGEFYREPWITHAWHRQRELDTNETNIREHIELFLKRKLLIPLGSQISQDELSSQSAQLISYNPAAGEPRPLDFPSLPQEFWQRKQDLVADMRMMGSVTDQEQGIAGSDPNGRAMAIINAEADQQLGTMILRIHSEWKEVHRAALILYQKYAHIDRKITVSGAEGVQSYSFEELNLQPGYDITIEEEDGLSRNPAIRYNETLQLAQVGFFVDPKTGQFDKKAFARKAKLKTAEQGYDAEATERAAASSVPYQIQRGIYQGPRNFDDPAIFYEELLGWMRGPGRYADPALLGQVEQIWMYYAQWFGLLQQQQLGPGMMPPPTPGVMGAIGPAGAQGGQHQVIDGVQQQGIQQEANQQVSQADQAGENLASGMTHES